MSLSWVAVDKTKDVVLLPQIELNANRWQSKPSKSESGGGGGDGLKPNPFHEVPLSVKENALLSRYKPFWSRLIYIFPLLMRKNRTGLSAYCMKFRIVNEHLNGCKTTSVSGKRKCDTSHFIVPIL